MKKRCAVLLAAAMLLSAAGCTQDSKRPEPTEPVASAVSETSVENVEAAEETPQKPQPSRKFDDSRISTLYDEEFSYTDPNGNKDTYFYEVPQIDDDTEDAKHINEMINYRYGYLVERAEDARSRNDFIDTSYIIWISTWTGPVLSLQITSVDTMYNRDVGAYHYNFETGKELSNIEMLEYLGYTDNDLTLKALQRAVAQHFDTYYGGDPSYASELCKMRAQSLNGLSDVFTYFAVYPYYTGGLIVTVPMYTLAGAGMMWTDIDVYPDKRQASGQILHGQDEWFTCDVTATGEVTVRALTDYVTPDGAVTYQTMKEWYELGDKTEFAVSGCYGNYVKMLMTSVGQDYAPYVFLLTEDGNVEYIDVISGAQCGTMANGGPLYGVNEIVKFEIGTAYDADFEAEYTTVYAVSRNNEKFNLVEAMHNADPMELSSLIGSYVSDYTGTWFEICEDQPNFYIGEYRNENREPATWDSGITYLGMDHRGWICSISLYRMDLGRAQRETVAMMPTDYGGFYVRHIGGESLLNLPKDESVWFEMTNE
jgi:hypothetical protein